MKSKLLPSLAVLAAVVLLASCSSSTGAPSASEFPEPGTPINYIVPYSTGGPADTQARITADLLGKALDTKVLVINKPGGNTVIGLTELAQAEPDGYTIGMISMPNALAWVWPGMQAPYDKEDFEPLSSTSDTTDIVAVKADSPFKDLQDLIDAAKADPGGVVASVEGAQSTDMLAINNVQAAAGVEFKTAIYAEGASQKVAALLGGQIDVATLAAATAEQHVKSGEFRVLASLSEQPVPQFPDAPTAASLGYDVVSETYYTVVLPAGAPDEVKQKLEDAMMEIGEQPEFEDKISALGLRPAVRTADEVSDLRDQVEQATTEALARLKS